ncbi:MAG: hypothetical protein IJO04_01570 [Oscillospiraceae bacterium]|nr:hypothetical protein [Oscillospiraceae bacterium]
MSDAKKRNKIIALCACFVLLGSLLVFLITCVSFSFSGIFRGCVSITFFEKQRLSSVDKVILTDEIEHQSVTITDKHLIGEIINQTSIATHANLGCAKSNSRRIDLFSGEQLIRSMKWSNCCENTVNVYDADGTHWIVPRYTLFLNPDKQEGWVIISRELERTLKAALRNELG